MAMAPTRATPVLRRFPLFIFIQITLERRSFILDGGPGGRFFCAIFEF